MIRAADLKAAADALATEHPTYWFNELATDADGLLIQPTHARYYLLRVATDPAVGDLDGEAYSLAVLTVQAWSTAFSHEFPLRDTAVAALAALGWERLTSNQIPGDNRRFGLTTDLEKTA